MNNQVIITKDNLNILNKEFKTNFSLDEMLNYQIKNKINRTVKLKNNTQILSYKTTSELKWYPRMNAVKAVNLTMNWYKEFYSNSGNIKDFTTKQILDFINE